MDNSSEQQLLIGMAAMTAAAEAHAASLALFPVVSPLESSLSSSCTTAGATSSRLGSYDLLEQHQHHQHQQLQSQQQQQQQVQQQHDQQIHHELMKKVSPGGKHRRCQTPGCDTQCNFGFPGSRAVFCFSHKLEGQINVNHRSCETLGCSRLATFAVPGDKPKLCGIHKQPGMKSRHRRPTCEHSGCSLQPVFGYPGESRRACATHRSIGMESKTSVRLCRAQVADGRGSRRGSRCDRRARFNHDQPGSKPEFCEEHRTEGMVCLRAGTCEVEGCSKRACFSFGKEWATTLCADHRQPGMVKRQRVVTCDLEDCPQPALQAESGDNASGGGDGGDNGGVADHAPQQQKRPRKRRCREHSTPGDTGPTRIEQHQEQHRDAGTAVTEATSSAGSTSSISSSSSVAHPPPPSATQAILPRSSARRLASRSAAGSEFGSMISPATPSGTGGLYVSPSGGSVGGGWVAGTAASSSASMAVAPVAGSGSGAILGDERCEHPGCWRDPVFSGYAGLADRLPRFCPVHRMDAIVDVSSSRCREGSCEALAVSPGVSVLWEAFCVVLGIAEAPEPRRTRRSPDTRGSG